LHCEDDPNTDFFPGNETVRGVAGEGAEAFVSTLLSVLLEDANTGF